jgi:hypothetical protein
MWQIPHGMWERVAQKNLPKKVKVILPAVKQAVREEPYL